MVLCLIHSIQQNCPVQKSCFSWISCRGFVTLTGTYRGWFHCWWGKEDMGRSPLHRGQPAMGLEPTQTGGATGLFWPLSSHKSCTQQRSVGWKKMSPWASSCTHQVSYCAGWEQSRAQRDLPQGLNVTRRVGALLSSQPLWGIIVGNERAGKTSAERVGGRKGTLHAGNTSDVWKNSEMSFPWSKELGWVIPAGGRRAALLSTNPPHAQRWPWQQLSRRGIATLSPLWMSYSIPAICLQWEVII